MKPSIGNLPAMFISEKEKEKRKRRKMVRPSAKKKSGRFNVILNDDLLGLILEKIEDSEDRESFSEVCKQWLRVERLTRTSLRVQRPIPRRVMTGFPYLVDLRTHELTTRRKKRNKRAWRYGQTDTRLEDIAKTCSKLETFMVNCMNYDDGGGCHLGPKGLHALGTGCPKLSTLLFLGHKAVGSSGVDALFRSAHSLKSLHVESNVLISNPALRAMGSSSISTLELVHCYNVTDEGLGFLANGSTSKTLKRLVIYGCHKITDTGVELLRNICSLEYLALHCNMTSQITDIGGMAISAIQTLKELKMSNLDVSDRTMVALAENCSKLETLDLQHCSRLTGAGIRAFSGHECLKHLSVMFCSANFDQSDVEAVALGCPSLKSVVLDKLIAKSFNLIHKNARRVIKFKGLCDFPVFSITW